MIAHSGPDYRAIDGGILDLVAEGRLRDAGRRLAEAYGPEVLGACIARTGDPHLGADAAQDALARALVALPSYEGRAGLRPWLHRIAANRCIDLLRRGQRLGRRRVQLPTLDVVAAPPQPMPGEVVEDARERTDRLAAVREALSVIKDPDRTWVELHYAHDVSYDDIAAQSGLTRAAVKQRIWRAMKRLRVTLARRERG